MIWVETDDGYKFDPMKCFCEPHLLSLLFSIYCNGTVDYFCVYWFYVAYYCIIIYCIILPRMTMTVHKEQMSTYIIIFSTHNKCLSSLVIRFPLNNSLFNPYHALFLLSFDSTCSYHLSVCRGGRCGSDPGNCLFRQVSLNT